MMGLNPQAVWAGSMCAMAIGGDVSVRARTRTARRRRRGRGIIRCYTRDGTCWCRAAPDRARPRCSMQAGTPLGQTYGRWACPAFVDGYGLGFHALAWSCLLS